jgi:hypothetical protein
VAGIGFGKDMAEAGFGNGSKWPPAVLAALLYAREKDIFIH